MNLKYQVSSIYPLLILVYHGISWTYHHFHSRRNHFPGGHPYSTTPRPGLWVLLVSEKSVSLVAMNHGDMSLRYTAYTYSYNLLYIYILYYIYSTYPAKEKISILGCPFLRRSSSIQRFWGRQLLPQRVLPQQQRRNLDLGAANGSADHHLRGWILSLPSSGIDQIRSSQPEALGVETVLLVVVYFLSIIYI